MTSLDYLKKEIKSIKDFPQPGVLFNDISVLLKKHWKETIAALDLLVPEKPDYWAGIESRGYLFAGALALKNNAGIIRIRKYGKLPPPVHCLQCESEYRVETLEIKDSEETPVKSIVIVDDVYATGGTMATAEKLCAEADYNVIGKLVLIDLLYLHKPNNSIQSVIQYKR